MIAAAAHRPASTAARLTTVRAIPGRLATMVLADDGGVVLIPSYGIPGHVVTARCPGPKARLPMAPRLA